VLTQTNYRYFFATWSGAMLGTPPLDCASIRETMSNEYTVCGTTIAAIGGQVIVDFGG